MGWGGGGEKTRRDISRLLFMFFLVEHMPRDAACIVGTKAEAAPPCPWPPDASISNGF